jgi:6-phosphogluconolactonase
VRIAISPQPTGGVFFSDFLIKEIVVKFKFCKFLLSNLILLILFVSSTYAQGNFIYSNNQDGVFPDHTNTVSGFSISSDGRLTEISGSPFQAGGLGGGGYIGTNNILVVDRILYASNAGSHSIAAFSINPATGELSSVSGSPFSIVGDALLGISLAATPDGRFLIATNNQQYTISVFQRAFDGSLSPISNPPYAVGAPITGIKISPNGKFLALATFAGVFMYSIGRDGVLTVVPGSPIPPLGHGINTSVDISCGSNLLFVTDYESYTYEDVSAGRAITASVFRIEVNGTLTHVGDTPPISGFGHVTGNLYLSPDGQRLFVSDSSFIRSIAAFTVGSNGTLSVVPGSPFSINGESISPQAVPFGMVTNSTGTRLYYAIYRNHIGGFTVAGNGALSPVPSSPFTPRAVGILTSISALAAYPAKTCGPIFDLCIQDDSNGSLLQINTTTGEYQFTNCAGFTIGGTGTLTRRGGVITLQHNSSDRRVMAKIDTSTNKATASVQSLSSGAIFSITDRNIANNTCACR